MIKKTENCLYCGEKMDSITAKKKFCCDLHRVYWHRMRTAADKIGEAISEHIKESKKETTTTKGIVSKFKVYDYSAMPQGLLHAGREAWKKKAREEQDKK